MAQLLSLAVVIVGLVGFDDPQQKEMPPAVKRYFEESDREKNERIEKLEVEIGTKISNAKTRKGLTAKDKKIQGDEINELKRSLESLKKSTGTVTPTINPGKFAVGQVGAIAMDSGHASVVVAAPGASRAHIFGGSTAKEFRVFHIVNAKEMLVEMYWYEGRSPIEKTSQPFWVKGIDTKGYTSNAKISLDGVFHISGTTSYDTDAGNMTVFVLEPLDLKPWLKK